MATYPYCLEPGLDSSQLNSIEKSLAGLNFNTRYNSIFVNSLELYTGSKFSINNFCQRIDGLQRILNSTTYRFNNVVGYNKITDITGSNNTFIGTNENLRNINTNNTITLGYNLLPQNNTIQFKPNKDGASYKILVPTTPTSYILDQRNNNYLVHDNYVNVSSNTSITAVNSKIFISNTSLTASCIDTNIQTDNFNIFLLHNGLSGKSSLSALSANSHIFIYNTTLSASCVDTNIQTDNFALSCTNGRVVVNTNNIVLTGNSVSLGRTAAAYQPNLLAFSNYNFTDGKPVLRADFLLQGITSGSSLTQIYCDNSTTTITIPNNSVWNGIINVVGYGVTDNTVARYTRQVTVSRINNNMVLQSEVVLGVDLEQSYSIGIFNDLAISASEGSLVIRVRGCNGNWKWSAYATGTLMYI